MKKNTLDGRPITAAISGFKSYNTERGEVPERPTPVLSPDDLLSQLRTLQATLNSTQLTRALTLLENHINDTNNPHNTDLDAFVNDVADILYNAYRDQGGIGSREFYLNCLFKTLRIASVEEMKEGTDENLLISIKGAKDYIHEHELDPEAHQELFDSIFPGSAPSYEPSFSCDASVGISNYFIKTITPGQNTVAQKPDSPDEGSDEEDEYNSDDICSAVGSDGRIHFSSYSDYDGVDYTPGSAVYACFGSRTNEIAYSEDFTKLTKINVDLELAHDVLSPSGSYENVTIMRTKQDVAPAMHYVSIPEMTLEANRDKTFSVYAKGLNCRYLAITWQDMTSSDIVVHAIFDLEQGTTMAINDLGRYSSRITRLTDGWYRCELTMAHPIGQVTDLSMLFFKEKASDWNMSFKGELEVCGYLWGMQFEHGPCASPYLPTRGKARTRGAVGYVIPLDEEWWESSAATIHVDWINVGKCYYEDTIRPVVTLTDDSDYEVLTCQSHHNGNLELLRYAIINVSGIIVPTVISQDLFPYDTRKWYQLTHGIDDARIVTLFNETKGLNLSKPEHWDSGTKLYLGGDQKGNALEGYIRSLVIYPRRASDEEARFMNGEEIHG